MKILKPLILIFLLQTSFLAVAQNKQHVSIIQSYLENNQNQLGLSNQDIDGWIVTNQVFSKSTGITSVYIQQTINGIPVHNATANIAIKDNQVVHFTNRLQRNLQQNLTGSNPSINPIEAISQAAAQLGLGNPGSIKIIDAKNPRNVIVSKGEISLEDIPVQLVFQPMEGKTNLAWNLSIHTKDGTNWWSLRIDANTGKILEKNDWILNCTFPEHSNLHKKQNSNFSILEKAFDQSLVQDGSQYNVFGFPVESPNHGVRQIVSNPANDAASPFGWHDTDGNTGAEYTTTRGNNVWAQDDFDGNDGVGYAPDGGSTLSFDFLYNGDDDPVQDYEDAAITNLFYVNNIMHDVWYQYGFDEASGNFQQNNYTGQGVGNDYVLADAQDGSGFNNAVFGTPPEGNNPRMQMFLWNPAYFVAPLTINNGAMAGGYVYTDNNFEPGHIDLPQYPNTLTGDLVLAIDATADINDGCSAFTNASSIAGNIAVVKRGTCTFTTKVLNAQNAGAIAVIVINNEGGTITMGGGDAGVTIPAVSITMAEGEDLLDEMEITTVNATLTDPHKQLVAQDGSFDNLIIAHEYGHGISTRLTGGASNTDCLFNSEQMGEGWSDWFGLMLTMDNTDAPEDPRGIGTYVVNQATTSQGIRNAPYSTDFSINPYTYGTTNNANLISEPHGIGFVWSTMLWDLTWALIEDYGFDPDVYNGTGGNNIAMQLVIDGLKLQPCNPGFVDGRDAILAADLAANGGANQCTIWRVFADRGLGYSADQGSSFTRNDQTQSFDMPPSTVVNCSMGTNEQTFENGIRIYPNPSKGIVNIDNNLQGIIKADFTIYDVNGRLVLAETLSLGNSASLDISFLSNGVYILKISTEENVITTKLVKE